MPSTVCMTIIKTATYPDDIQSLTKSYENHISIGKIKKAYPEIVPDNFHCKAASLDDVKKGFLI